MLFCNTKLKIHPNIQLFIEGEAHETEIILLHIFSSRLCPSHTACTSQALTQGLVLNCIAQKDV